MATADMSGLFGPTPFEIQQAQQQALQSQASAYANQTPLQRAAQGMFTAGGQVAGLGAQAMGMVNPQQQIAQKMQEAQSGIDISTPEGMMQYAAKIKDFNPGVAAQIVAQARDAKMKLDATALAARKQDFQENEALQLKKDQLSQAADLKKQQLEQQAEAARIRSEDRQASTQQRADAASEANATKLQIAQLMAEMKRMGIESKAAIGEKPMSPAQAFKQKQAEAKSSGQLRGMDNSFENLSSAANAIVTHPGLSSATGLTSLIPSMPGGQASQVDNLISEFKSGVKKTGLDLVRQGGGIGAMSEKEWPIVEGMVAEINPRAGKEAVISQINKVLAKVDQVRQNAYQTHNEGFDTSLVPKPIAPSAVPSAPLPATKFSFKTPQEVKAAMGSAITRDQAKAILLDMQSRGIEIK